MAKVMLCEGRTNGRGWRLWSSVLACSRAARMCGPRKAGFIYKGLIIPERGQAQDVFMRT